LENICQGLARSLPGFGRGCPTQILASPGKSLANFGRPWQILANDGISWQILANAQVANKPDPGFGRPNQMFQFSKLRVGSLEVEHASPARRWAEPAAANPDK